MMNHNLHSLTIGHLPSIVANHQLLANRQLFANRRLLSIDDENLSNPLQEDDVNPKYPKAQTTMKIVR